MNGMSQKICWKNRSGGHNQTCLETPENTVRKEISTNPTVQKDALLSLFIAQAVYRSSNVRLRSETWSENVFFIGISLDYNDAQLGKGPNEQDFQRSLVSKLKNTIMLFIVPASNLCSSTGVLTTAVCVCV